MVTGNEVTGYWRRDVVTGYLRRDVVTGCLRRDVVTVWMLEEEGCDVLVCEGYVVTGDVVLWPRLGATTSVPWIPWASCQRI